MSDSLKAILIASLTLICIVLILVVFRLSQLDILNQINWNLPNNLFLPLIVACLSAFIASQALKTSKMALQAEDSPRLYNEKIVVKKNHNQTTVLVNAYNYGKSPALKTYLLLKYDKKGNSEYHLSKPETIYPLCENGTELLVEFPNTENKKAMNDSLIKTFEGVTEKDIDTMSSKFTLFIFTYDFFGRFYYKKEYIPYKNDHLIRGYEPFILTEKDDKQSKLIKYYWDKAISQKNTYKHKKELNEKGEKF